MERYAACTFFASVPAQQDANDTDAVIKNTVKFLVENEFVRLQRCDDTKTDENKENNDETEEVRLKRKIRVGKVPWNAQRLHIYSKLHTLLSFVSGVFQTRYSCTKR